MSILDYNKLGVSQHVEAERYIVEWLHYRALFSILGCLQIVAGLALVFPENRMFQQISPEDSKTSFVNSEYRDFFT